MAYSNITLNPSTSATTYTLSGLNGTSATDVWTNTAWSTSPVTITQKATIDLKGEDADIIINGESLNETLKSIRNALRIPERLVRNEQLESDFDELKAAHAHYEELLKKYAEKQKVWNALKNTDL